MGLSNATWKRKDEILKIFFNNNTVRNKLQLNPYQNTKQNKENELEDVKEIFQFVQASVC